MAYYAGHQPRPRGESDAPSEICSEDVLRTLAQESHTFIQLPLQRQKTQTQEDIRNSSYYLSTMSISNDNDYASSESIYNLCSDGSACGRQIDLKNSDLAIQNLEELENELEIQFDQLLEINRAMASGEMSDSLESSYNQRRDEINRRLGDEEEELNDIVEERDQAIKDKQNVESAISDVQEKYDRVLRTLLTLKEKEELLIERDRENLKKVEKMDKELEEYKETARQQVESEYQNWLSKLAEAEATNVRLKALLRKGDLQVEKMEFALGQRTKENTELHTLCDELIQSGGSRKNSVQE